MSRKSFHPAMARIGAIRDPRVKSIFPSGMPCKRDLTNQELRSRKSLGASILARPGTSGTLGPRTQNPTFGTLRNPSEPSELWTLVCVHRPFGPLASRVERFDRLDVAPRFTERRHAA